MNKYLISTIGVLLLVLLATWYFYPSETPTPPIEDDEEESIDDEEGENNEENDFPTETDTSIKLYFYNPALDQGPGGVQCSKDGLVAVERVIPKTMTPLADAVRLLLRGEISNEEQTSGIESEFPLPGVTLKGATITDGVATLTFGDPQNKTSGGSCRAGILWAQIEATAKQFPTVESVRFMPEELFQP